MIPIWHVGVGGEWCMRGSRGALLLQLYGLNLVWEARNNLNFMQEVIDIHIQFLSVCMQDQEITMHGHYGQITKEKLAVLSCYFDLLL